MEELRKRQVSQELDMVNAHFKMQPRNTSPWANVFKNYLTAYVLHLTAILKEGTTTAQGSCHISIQKPDMEKLLLKEHVLMF